MDADLHEQYLRAAWDQVHDNTPDGWYVGQPGYEERYRQWSMYAFDPSEKSVVGKRSREWTAVGQTELHFVQTMAYCMGELNGRGGDDIICGGLGNDRLVGGAGSDCLKGQYGRDTLIGGLGQDWLWGGADPDRLLGGKGHDFLDGGFGSDVCRPGPASGPHVQCEDVPLVTPQNLAIAWSDLDGDNRYGPRDVLISRLFDTNGDGIPSKGDTIYMGKYPADFEMTAFDDWGVASHTVEEGYPGTPQDLAVETSSGWFGWHHYRWYSVDFPAAYTRWRTWESYRERLTDSYTSAYISDQGARSQFDVIKVGLAPSPSQPTTPIDRARGARTGDQGFIDVVVYP